MFLGLAFWHQHTACLSNTRYQWALVFLGKGLSHGRVSENPVDNMLMDTYPIPRQQLVWT